jgi:dihydroxyacetone kinase
MTRIFNDPADFKDEMTSGFVSAYARYVEKVPAASGVMRVGGARHGKVSLVIGGGSGHYPAFCGVVGSGLADGAVMGDIFASPSTEQVYRVAKALDGGAGVLLSYGNYAGDVLNFDAAQERLRGEGMDVRTVLCTDDIASAPAGEEGKRRGIAGDFPVFKAAGAATDRGANLDEVERIARKANDRTRTLGVAFAGCTFPGRSEPLFTVAPDRMELGLGIHGEPGVRSVERMSARELAAALVEPLLQERPADADGRVAVIVNGLGATKYEELFVLWNDVRPLLEATGARVILPEVGELVTSLDMAGCSLTLHWLDDELEELWAAPADTPAFRRGEVSTLPVFERRAAAVVAGEAAAQQVVQASPESERAAATARTALAEMLRVVTDNEAELGRLDTVAGDGDHGVGMVRGMQAANSAAESASGGVGSVLRSAGTAFGDKAGGTSGMLWGAILEAFGQELGDTEAPTAQRVADAVRRSAEVVQRLGRAKVGDKTMLDALVPFAEVLHAEVAAGHPLPRAWASAAAIATESAQRTADLVPKLGRARPLAERSLGTPDPGATSMALVLAAASEVIARDC